MAITAQLSRVYDLSANINFQWRIAAALIDQVSLVATEAGATPDHANRLAFASLVAYNTDRHAKMMAIGIVVVNANIQAQLNSGNPDTNNNAVADADIKAGVSTVWDFYANSAASLTAATKLV